MKLNIRNSFLIAAALCSAGAAADDFNVTPGGLQDILGSVSGPQLTLAGEIDARDLSLMRSLPEGVTSLDLSATSVKSFSSKTPEFFGRTFFADNELPEYCFFASGLSKVVLPAGIVRIPQATFAGAAVTEIVIPEGVTEIGDYAFYDCKNLRSVSFPSSLKKIGRSAFANCPSLVDADLSATLLTLIPDNAFAGDASLKTMTLPASVTEIGREAFRGTAIQLLSLDGVETLQPYALSGMHQLKAISINGVVKAGEGALMDNPNLITISGSLDNVPDLFAANCGMLDPSIVLAGAQNVGDYALANSSASELVLGSGITSLGAGVFLNLSSLDKIEAQDLRDNIPAVTADTFAGIDRPSVKLHVSDDAYEAWKADPEWGQFQVVSDIHTGVDDAVAEADDILVRLNGEVLTVVAPEPITSLDIFSLDGRLLYATTPGTSALNLDLSGVETGDVLLVSVIAGDSRKAAKLMR